MGLFFKKKIGSALDEGRKTTSYIWIGLCLILIGVNIAVFLTLPKVMAPMAIALSNALTMILTAFAFKPVNDLVQSTLASKQEELSRKMEAERQLQERVASLEAENRDLEQQLQTRQQTSTMPADINFTFKLEQMEFSKKGYIVKREDLEDLDKEVYGVPDKPAMDTLLENMGVKSEAMRKILYIHKFYYKASIGINFSKIKYTTINGRIIFYGVKFSLLHDISSELVPDSEDIEMCEILKVGGEKGEKLEIRSGSEYDKLKETYRREQAALAKKSIEEEVEDLCSQYTRVFRESIRERFPDISFVESIDDSDLNWYILSGSNNAQVAEVAANMLMLTSLINKTRSLEENSPLQLGE